MDLSSDDTTRIVREFIPGILAVLLSRNILDESQNYSKKDLWDSVYNNATDEIIGELIINIKASSRFQKYAGMAAKEGGADVAIVLIAIVIEHELNFFYRNLLEVTGLSTSQTTQAIKALSIDAKLSWFFLSTTGHQLSSELLKDVAEVIEIRNSLVHYKAIPSNINDNSYWRELEYRIKIFDLDVLLNLPQKLRVELEAINDEKITGYARIKEWCQIMFDD